MTKWKKGNILVSASKNNVVYTGKNKHNTDFFEEYVILSTHASFPIGYYSRTWSRETFKNEIK